MYSLLSNGQVYEFRLSRYDHPAGMGISQVGLVSRVLMRHD